MATIADLRKLGFQLASTPNAVECTTLELPRPFYFANAKFCTGPEQLVASLKPALPTGVGTLHALIVAGEFHDSADFPFTIVLPETYRDLQVAAQRIRLAREAQKEAERELARLFVTHLPGVTF